MRRHIALLVSFAIGGVAVLLPQQAAAIEAYPGCSAVTLYAHRGDQTGGNTENSIGSLDLAASHGFSFETDLRTTNNGKIILMHDTTLGRTTTGTGYVSRMTRRKIQSYRLDDGSIIPRVDDALAVLTNNPNATAMLELKPGAMPPSSLLALRDKVNALDLRSRVTVFSFGRTEVLNFRSIAPSFSTTLISTPAEADWTPDRFIRFGGANIRPEDRTTDWIQRAHDIGLLLNGRDAEDVQAWQAGADAKVRGQVLDHAAEYQTWCGVQ